jgi:hypothetical protein
MRFVKSWACVLVAASLGWARVAVSLAQETSVPEDFAGQVVYQIKPSQTDPAIQRFD